VDKSAGAAFERVAPRPRDGCFFEVCSCLANATRLSGLGYESSSAYTVDFLQKETILAKAVRESDANGSTCRRLALPLAESFSSPA